MGSTRRYFSILIALLLLGAGGCATAPGGSPGNPQVAAPVSAASLRPGDSLVVSLQGIPDPSSLTVQIDEQGVISLPYIGSVEASGLNSADLSQKIRRTYIEKKIYTAINISVAVTERYVYVGGEVSRPGRIIWTPDLTLTKAVQAAGGFTLYAKENQVILTREREAHDINANTAQKDPHQDPLLFPGDAIQVPRSPF